MGLVEVTSRSRTEALKHLDRSRGFTRAARAAMRDVSALPDAGVKPSRFFEGAGNPETPLILRQRAPAASAAIVRSAEAASQGRFDLLGYRAVSFGDPIDWHLDPISGVRCPRVHWSRIDVLDATLVGDSKVVWELNRLQWLVRLGQAYGLTADESHCEAFVRYVRQWNRANPPGQGINWASSLEVALRLISLLWALHLFQGSRSLPRGFVSEVLQIVATHAAHVERYLSRYYSPNTHLTGEALGLLYAGLALRELRSAKRWRRRGLRILLEQSVRQISNDGVYFEQSTCYQRYTAEIYLHVGILAARNGLTLPSEVRGRLESLLDFLLWTRSPSGSMPFIGDADGGWLLPLHPRAADDLAGVFSTAAVCLGRGDYAEAAGGRVGPETLWLLGPGCLSAFDALKRTPPDRCPSRLFDEGGYAVMRGGWERDAHQLIFDVGPIGELAHGHADLLAIQCSVFGEPYIVDAGTYCYTPDPGWRDHFRNTAAHNTVTVDRAAQAVASGPFSWRTRPRARLLGWSSTSGFDLADAEHTEYRRTSGVAHRRRVIFVKSRYWIVIDDLQGTGQHTIQLRFQFAPMRLRTAGSPSWICADQDGGRGLLIRAFARVRVEAEIREGETKPAQGWVSPDYGQRVPAPLLIYSATTPLPLRVLTLLLPVQQVSAHRPHVSALLDEDGLTAGVRFEDSGEQLRVGYGAGSVWLSPGSGVA